jgi:hypothetical protein
MLCLETAKKKKQRKIGEVERQYIYSEFSEPRYSGSRKILCAQYTFVAGNKMVSKK